MLMTNNNLENFSSRKLWFLAERDNTVPAYLKQLAKEELQRRWQYRHQSWALPH